MLIMKCGLLFFVIDCVLLNFNHRIEFIAVLRCRIRKPMPVGIIDK